jgi:diguanylate cyclase (GGDEF)-like protein/PAS domain S-box-containing protein
MNKRSIRRIRPPGRKAERKKTTDGAGPIGLDDFIKIQRDLAVKFGSCSSLSELLDIVLQAVMTIPAVDAGGIYLVDEETGDLDLKCHQGLTPDFIKRSAHFGRKTPHAKLVMAGKIIMADNPRLRQLRDAIKKKEGLKALAVLPVSSDGRIVAAINISSRRLSIFPPLLVSHFDFLAAQTGIVITRLRCGEAVRESSENLERFMSTVEDLIFVLDLDGRIIHTTPATVRRTGYALKELVGMPLAKLHPADQAHNVMEFTSSVFADETKICHLPIRCKDGSLIPIETRVVKGIWSGREAIFGISRDVTERARYEEELLQRSITDPLTQIYNRGYFYERAAQELAKCSRGKSVLSIAIIDIDHFKSVNDSFGHAAGDHVLVELASILKQGFRNYDVLTRYGGEEFGIILTDTRKTEALRILKRIQTRTVNHRFRHAMQSMAITFSCGIADTTEFQPKELSLDAVIKLADDRLYTGKMQGRNRIVI